MSFDRKSLRRTPALMLGLFTLAVVVLLFVQDATPRLFPAHYHEILSAICLAAIAAAYLVFQFARRSAFAEWIKAILLAAAFLFWAANQYWPNLPQAGLFNDIAIGLFVLDVFLAIAGWPAESSDGVFTEGDKARCCREGCCDGRGASSEGFDPLVESLREVDAGRRFSRSEFNER